MSPGVSKELERQGRNLWNLCVRVKRDGEEARHSPDKTTDRTKLLVRARVFSFQILSLARERRRDANDVEKEVIYLLNLSLTVGRFCIAESEMDLARLVLQKAAEYVEKARPTAIRSSPSGSEKILRKLEAEYLAMRTALVTTPFSPGESRR